MATVAALIRSISVSGYGSAAASGSAYFFKPGTTVQEKVYQDSAGAAVYAQPVTLDADGRSVAPVYSLTPVRMQVFSAAGALLDDFEVENVTTADQVALNDPAWSSADLGTALSAIATSFGAADGNVSAPGSGAVARALRSKLGEPYVSVADYGAKGDGVADDTAAVIAAVNVIKNAGSGELFFPSGTYKTTTTVPINVTGYIRIRGNGKSSVLAPTFAGAVFTFGGAGASGINITSIMMSGLTSSLMSIASGTLLSLLMSDVLAVGTALLTWTSAPTGVLSTWLSCRSYTDQDRGFLGPLWSGTPGAGTQSVVVGCFGNIGGVGTDGTLVRVGGDGTITSASTNGTVSIVGGNGVINVTSPAPSPVVLGPVSTIWRTALGTDTAVDSIYTMTGSGTVNASPVQGMITVKANTAGIAVAVALTPISRLSAYQTICFWNNTGGAVTFSASTGISFRAAAPAPGAGLKVYVTFVADPVGTYVEVART